MAVRQSTGKRLRFRVFERDRFTCQYCGAQPPAVVLVVDHITPVARGGATDEVNLITSCEPCNQGKAARELGTVAPRPDADLLYLAAQQEAAEVRRYMAALDEREAALGAVIARFQGLWAERAAAGWHPAAHLVRQIIDRYGLEVAGSAMEDVACKIGGGYLRSYGDKWVRYLWAVARNMAAGEGE